VSVVCAARAQKYKAAATNPGMTPAAGGRCGFAVVDFDDMKIDDRIKRLFQRRATAETPEERAARAKAERERDEVIDDAAVKNLTASFRGPDIPPF
jgi:hypothetical protein